MRITILCILLLLPTSSAISAGDGQLVTTTHPPQNSVFDVDTFIPKGVVIVDNHHQNDYTANDMNTLLTDLTAKEYVVKYSQDFPSFAEAVSAANYLIMSAPYSDLEQTEIDAITSWFESTSAHLLLASRGDFAITSLSSSNALLEALNATIRIQDDNVNTIDPNAYRAWYIDTDNFNLSGYPQLFDGVDSLSFFSPTSLIDTEFSDVLVTAEKEAYQVNENGDGPNVIYDNTNDGEGGEAIPLALIEEISSGDDADQVIVLGTTLWSDFDYRDSFADDPVFFNNILSFFRDHLIETTSNVTMNIVDTDAPLVKITYPGDGSILKGTINITTTVTDPFGVVSTGIYVNDELRSSSSYYVWDTTQEDPGEYEVKVMATDASDNVATVEHTYTIDQEYIPQNRDAAKILTYNIFQSGGAPQWLDVMKEENPDVAMLVETGDFDNNNNALLDDYTDQLNDYFFDKVPYDSYTLPSIEDPWDGITLLSRYEITSAEKIDSLTDDEGEEVNVPLPFLYATIDIEGIDVHIIGAHLTSGQGDTNEIARERQQEAINNFMDETIGDHPIIYLGDLNAESPEEFSGDSDLGTEPIKMLLDAEHPKASQIHEFIDVYTNLNPGSFESTYVGAYLSRIDYIFVNQYFHDYLTDSTIGDTASANLGSDHRTVDVTIDIKSFVDEFDDNPAVPDGGFLNYYVGIFVLIPIVWYRRKARAESTTDN